MFTSYGQGQYSASAAANEAHILFTAGHDYQADGTKRLVVWCHSAGGLALEPDLAANNVMPLLEAIVSTLGLPCISFDGQPPSGGQAQHWGNDTAQSRMNDAISFAAARLNAKVDKVIVVGVSMGGMLALNWARANPSKVAGLALMYPATSLQAMHDGTGGAAAGGAATTEAAYGGSTAAFNAAVAAHDPAQNAAAVAALGVPMRMWYSDSDNVVGTLNQDAFVKAVGKIDTRRMRGAGHADLTRIDALDLLAFAKGVM